MGRKQVVVNKGPYIRNANLIGNGPKASPIDGSFVKGIEHQRLQEAKERLVKNAEQAQSHSVNQSVNRIRKITP